MKTNIYRWNISPVTRVFLTWVFFDMVLSSIIQSGSLLRYSGLEDEAEVFYTSGKQIHKITWGYLALDKQPQKLPLAF